MYFTGDIVLANGVDDIDVYTIGSKELGELVKQSACVTCTKPKTPLEVIDETAKQFAEMLSDAADVRFTTALVKSLMPKLKGVGLL